MSREEAGRAAYVEDCRRRPRYDDGGLRRSWDDLPDYIRDNWNKNPTPREWK